MTVLTAQPDDNAMPSSHTIVERHDEGFIEITSIGFFSDEELRAGFAQTQDVVTRWRSAGRPIRVLLDATKLVVRSAQQATVVQEQIDRIYRQEDRVAVIVESSLVKMQLRRLGGSQAANEYFVSKHAASLWLGAGLEHRSRAATA